MSKRLITYAKGVTGLAVIVLFCWFLAQLTNWLASAAVLLVLLAISIAVPRLSRRNETFAVITDTEPAGVGFDERQKLIQLRSRAIAGRVALIVAGVPMLTLSALAVLAQDGRGDAPVTLPVGDLISSLGGIAALPVLAYLISHVCASWYYDRHL